VGELASGSDALFLLVPGAYWRRDRGEISRSRRIAYYSTTLLCRVTAPTRTFTDRSVKAGGGVRGLGIPNVIDRVVCEAVWLLHLSCSTASGGIAF
jgi:hypothetical protein